MKGQGKFYRMASPGGREGDLTPWQAERAGEIGAPLLAEVCSRRGPAG